MIVTPISPAPSQVLGGADAPLGLGDPSALAGHGDAGAFARALDGALEGTSGRLERADAAERAFVSGRGTLQAMVLERAQADVALSIASAAASRVTQALSTILGMQV